MRVNSMKFDEEDSQSWVIGGEALIVGIFLGHQASNAGASSAAAFGVGVVAALGFYALVVLVSVAFWLWTLGLAAFASYGVHRWLTGAGVDGGWVLIWTAAAGLIVVGLHMKSRVHSYAEDFGPRMTRVKGRQ